MVLRRLIILLKNSREEKFVVGLLLDNPFEVVIKRMLGQLKI